MSTDLEQLRETVEQARLEREMAVLKAETAAVNGANFPGMYIPEVERPSENLQEGWGDTVPVDQYPGGENFDGTSNPRASGLWNTVGAQLGDRRYGQDEQVFRNEIEHARIRAIGRLLCNKSVNAKAVQNNLTSYILGTGFTYKVVPEEGETPKEKLMEAVQAIIKEVMADNKWWKRERQLFKRSRRDGEFFTALYHVGGGRVQLRTIEPEQVSEPDDPNKVAEYFGLPDAPWSWSFGIATDDDDMEAVHGYHVRWRTQEGRDTAQWFPESDMVHCKLNVDENIKRGVSDFYAVYEQLIDAGKLARNTVKGHAIMAAIAFIREHASGVTQTQVESMRSGNAWSRYNQATRTEGTRTRYTHHYEPGTVVDTPHGTAYKPSPMAEQGVGQSMIAVEEAVLQISATNWCMPGYMITGSTGDTAYAASLVAESPFVKYAEAEQLDTAEEFVEIFWKAIRIAYAAGRLDGFGVSFEDLKQRLKIQVDKPIVASRDRNVETNRLKILCDAGILSEETWTHEEGYDREREVKRGAKVKEVQAPFAGGDQPGKSVQGPDKKKAEGSLREHMGPGSHPSGSEQEVHGGEESATQPSWSEGSAAYASGDFAHGNIKFAQKVSKVPTYLELSADKFSDTHVAIGPSTSEMQLFLQDALHRPVESYRTGWLVTPRESQWLGFKENEQGVKIGQLLRRTGKRAKQQSLSSEKQSASESSLPSRKHGGVSSIAESRLHEAAALLWGNYPGGDNERCVTEGEDARLTNPQGT